MTQRTRSRTAPPPSSARRIAVIGAGMAGIVCARTLAQAGHQVRVFERGDAAGGRMACLATPFGGFDHGAQYFTVRDARFQQALDTVPGLCRPWSANTVRVLDPHGRVAAAALSGGESHWVPAPGMDALLRQWAAPLLAAQALELGTQATAITPDAIHPDKWQIATVGTPGEPQAQHVFGGFDAVALAVPHAQAQQLLRASGGLAPALQERLSSVSVGPCWTLLLAFPQAVQATLAHLGPQWNAARSTHHRIAWLARESSKPGRGSVERWTVQASTAWSAEHQQDDAARVLAKLRRAFSEVTGIRAEPAFAQVHGWHQAQTLVPLGASHLWDRPLGIGLAGDWCLGHRVEDAFVSGLELALSMA